MNKTTKIIVGMPENRPASHTDEHGNWIAEDWTALDQVVHVSLIDGDGDDIDSEDFVVPFDTPDAVAQAALEDCGSLPDGSSVDATIDKLLADNELTRDDVSINIEC